MRVVAGELGGRKLIGPPDDRTRPTSERVREAMLNALHSRGAVEDATVLDLFAGTGALGIEALSRGAAHATFVEPDREMRRVLTSNLDALGLHDRATVVNGPAARALQDPSAQRFDVALLDPPYAFEGWFEVLDRLPAPLAVIESPRAVELPPGWDVVREKRHGGTLVTIVERAAPVRGRALDGPTTSVGSQTEPTMDETARGDQ